MAERACRDGSPKRPAFLRALVEAGLPDDALERLEAKRKQLDESIHRYIAAKEREYKNTARDELQRHRLRLAQSDPQPRQAFSGSTKDTAASSPPQRQQQNVVDALPSAGWRKENIGRPYSIAMVDEDDAVPTSVAKPSMAGLTDQRASMDRDKEFIGVFTPTFLPAFEDGRAASCMARAESAPPVVGTSTQAHPAESQDMQRANSDTVVQAQQKRPLQLQLASRTSSSGSSADGGSRLASALKSPTHPRPKRKRVSLAVGDTIVAPSDNVPILLGWNNGTPSHSRPQSPASDRESLSKKAKSVSSPTDSPQQAESMTAPFSPLARVTMTSQLPLRSGNGREKHAVVSKVQTKSAGLTTMKPAVDGDLDFALDEEDMIPNRKSLIPGSQDQAEEVTGRIRRTDDDGAYQPSEEQIIEEGEESDHHAEHIEFHPSSVQQTNIAGFRRPSVSTDPVFTGRDYDRAERNAVTNEIYGSSYARPSKGSFTAGSLGESFMATNAARMMKDRRSSQHAQIRS